MSRPKVALALATVFAAVLASNTKSGKQPVTGVAQAELVLVVTSGCCSYPSIWRFLING